MASDHAVTPVLSSRTLQAGDDTPLPVSTLPLYLFGSRAAILRIAESRAALWIGFLFVVSAGLAREYDGADLLHEPWHLALPLVASLGTSLVLYALVFVAARIRGVRELTFWHGYSTLLTFYWWTAPLAWLYAIPVERFLSAGDATITNLWLLAAVSVWRVLLITRAVSVWLGASFIGMFFIVMFFADTVAVVLALVSPKPIFNVMGGVRLSHADRAVLDATLTVIFLGGMSWVVWLAGAAIVIGKKSPPWSIASGQSAGRRVSAPLWALAGVLIVLGLGLLPFGQSEQQHRSHVEGLLRAGQLDAAAQYVNGTTRDDLPPVWDPPPRVGYGEDTPPVLDVLDAIEKQGAPAWFREMYLEKIAQDPSEMLRDAMPNQGESNWGEFERVLSVLENSFPAESFKRTEEWFALRRIADDERIDAPLRERLAEYLGTSGGEKE